MPKKILRAWKNFLLFNIEYFSIPLLLKTLFAHWRRYKWVRGRGFDLGEYLGVLSSNLISRTLGFIMRTILITIGLIAETLILFIGITVLIGWIALPALLIIGVWFGFKLI